MRKGIFFLMVACATMVQAQIFTATQNGNSVAVYKNGLLVGTASATTVAAEQTTLQTTINPDAVINGNQVQFNGAWVNLPKAGTIVAVAENDGEMIAIETNGDSAFSWRNNQWFGQRLPIPGTKTSIDIRRINGALVGAVVTTTPSNTTCFFGPLDGSEGGGSFETTSNSQIKLLGSINYKVTSSSIELGTLTFPFTPATSLQDSQQVCGANWCIYAPVSEAYPNLHVGYLKTPYEMGLLLPNQYTDRLYTLNAVATPNTAGRFTASIDVPLAPMFATADTATLPQSYAFEITKHAEGFGKDGKQRLVIVRVMNPADPEEKFRNLFCFDADFVRYEDGQFEFGNGREDHYKSSMVIFDSLGQYVREHLMPGDGHDLARYEQYSVRFGHWEDSVSFWHPPVVVDNTTGQEWTITPADSAFMPRFKDSCNVAISGPFGVKDWDHGNGLDIMYVPTLGEWVILRSARNIAKWPISWPLAAWRWNPTAKFRPDRQLIDMLNGSPFGYGRDGGHNIKWQRDLSNETANTWLISQYDNVVCDDPTTGPSWAHSATLHCDSTGNWHMSDFRKFEGSPSTAMGNTGLYRNGADTLIIINSGGGLGGSDEGIYKAPQASIRNFTTGEMTGGIMFGHSNHGGTAIAYQCNETSEIFSGVPGFKAHWQDRGTDSVQLVLDSVPMGTWYPFFENTTAVVFPKWAVTGEGGFEVFITGQYSERDTFPRMEPDALPNRWVSYPRWIPYGTTSIEKGGLEEDLNLHIYPNPTNGWITILGGNINDVTVTDITGKQFPVTVIDNRVNLGNVAQGVYFVNLTYGNRKVTKRIIKI